MVDHQRQIVAARVLGYSIGSWCPTPDGTGPAMAVAIQFDVQAGNGTLPFLVRLKSRRAVDEMIANLAKFRDEVWPQGEAP